MKTSIAAHFLLDTRLMTAWVEALHANGQDDAVRHLVQRLREFRNAGSKEFLGACVAASSPPPFQCQPATREVHWRELAR